MNTKKHIVTLLLVAIAMYGSIPQSFADRDLIPFKLDLKDGAQLELRPYNVWGPGRDGSDTEIFSLRLDQANEISLDSEVMCNVKSAKNNVWILHKLIPESSTQAPEAGHPIIRYKDQFCGVIYVTLEDRNPVNSVSAPTPYRYGDGYGRGRSLYDSPEEDFRSDDIPNPTGDVVGDLSYFVHSDCRGQSLASLSAQTVVNHIFRPERASPVRMIQALAADDNEASLKVLDKIGFKVKSLTSFDILKSSRKTKMEKSYEIMNPNLNGVSVKDPEPEEALKD